MNLLQAGRGRRSDRGPATTGGRSRRPWIVALLAALVFVVGVAIDIDSEPWFSLMFGAIVLSFCAVGAVICTRVPGNGIGPLMLGAGTFLAIVTAAGSYAKRGTLDPANPWPLAVAAALLDQVGFILPMVAVLIGVPLVFPDGRLLSRRWRWLVALSIVAMTCVTLGNLLRPGPAGPTSVANPLGAPELASLLDALEAFASWTSPLAFGGAVLALALRYRGGKPIERQQVRWLVAVAAVAALAFPTSFVLPGGPLADAAFLVGLLAMAALPVAIAIAVTRYRLYDLDRVISRTVSWAIISGVLVGVFAVLVVGLQALLAGVTQGATLAVAASTLLAFASFQPVRRRIQSVVDRRFDRARYDAERTATAFTERLRDEVDLEAVATDLQGTVRDAFAPATLAVWLRRP
ncbi:MAG TPA: hypothetical protein VH440_00565 [Candidatus Limnocylindrales bacterium]